LVAMGPCQSTMQTDIGFAADKTDHSKDIDAGNGRRQALDIFQIDLNFKRVVHKKGSKTRGLLTEKLSTHPLFEALGVKELEELVDAMKEVRVAKNQVLVGAGDAMNEMYILEVMMLGGE